MTTSRVRLCGVSIDPTTEEAVCDRVATALRHGTGGLIVTANLDHVRRLNAGDPMAPAYARADLVLADGAPLVWAARLQGTPLPGRVAGSDLLWSLSAVAARLGLPITLVGGSPGSADAAGRRLREHAPGLTVAATLCPTLSALPSTEETSALADEVTKSGGAIVFTGLGSPKQELVNLVLVDRQPGCWHIGVGAAIDMAAGLVSRAPLWAQRSGLEWVFRLAQEPGRLTRRYLVDDLPFAARLFASAARGRWRPDGDG